MCKTRLINLRFSAKQFEDLKQKMEIYGYLNMSQYIRDCCLRDDFSTLVMIRDMHKRMMGDKQMMKIVYRDDGQVKVVKGAFAGEDSIFIMLIADEKEYRIRKEIIERTEKEIEKNETNKKPKR